MGSQIRIALLPSFNADPVAPHLKSVLTTRGLDCDIFLPGFDQYRQQILVETSTFYQFDPNIVIMFVDAQDLLGDLCQSPLDFNEETSSRRLREALEEIIGYADLVLQRLPNATLLVNNLAAPVKSGVSLLEYNSAHAVRAVCSEFNRELGQALRSRRRAFVIDYDALVAKHGFDQWFDPRLWYLARMRLGGSAVEALAKYIATYISAIVGTTRKCLVLDLDNTLWGGIVGTDGPAGIRLGTEGIGLAFREFQIEVLNLFKRGVLLALNSSNNFDDAIEVIDQHPSMVLRREHFSAMRINWQEKATNLTEIAEELNIGLDALVFLDDDTFQVELVRARLPEVQVIQVPDDPSMLRQTLLDMDLFPALSLTDEDRTRGRMYNQEMQRRELRSAATSLEAFLASLGMQASIGNSDSFVRSRIAQLTQRTNQFNLTTRRYTDAQIETIERSPHRHVYCLSLSDKFGDNGLVGLSIITCEADSWVIDTLLLSCRVMGRGVETSFIAFLSEQALRHGYRYLRGEFLPTKKNAPVRDLYPKHGFTPEDQEGHWWRLDLESAKIDYPDYIKVKFDGEVIDGALSNR